MPIKDWNGTNATEIGKLYDYDGATSHEIAKVYDYDGTTNSLIYQAVEPLYLLNGQQGSGWSIEVGGWAQGGIYCGAGSSAVNAWWTCNITFEEGKYDKVDITHDGGNLLFYWYKTGEKSYYENFQSVPGWKPQTITYNVPSNAYKLVVRISIAAGGMARMQMVKLWHS